MIKRFGLMVSLCLLVGTNLAFSESMKLVGAGATFPYPLYSKMFDTYYKEKGVQINYQAIGSGGGIRQLISQTVDFGASDAPMTDKKLAESAPILHIPTSLGAVAVAYNLKGVESIRLSGDVLAKIFLGKIKKWNDDRIQAINPGKKLPSRKIVVVHRSDGSGTSYIFTDYLSKVSQKWEEKVGRGKAVNWPTGLGGKGNAGVAGYIQQIPGSIGYIEMIYALQNNISVVAMQNVSGKYVLPSVPSTTAAVPDSFPADTRMSITDTKAPDGYPISGLTWILLYQEQDYHDRTLAQAKAATDLVRWMVADGQTLAPPLNYAPLPKKLAKRAQDILKTVTYKGNIIP